MAHTLQIDISDGLYDTFIAYIRNLPQNSISVKEIDTTHKLSDIYLQDKEMFNQRFEDIQNGDAVLLSQDAYQAKMNNFTNQIKIII